MTSFISNLSLGKRGKDEVWHKSSCKHEGEVFTVHRGKKSIAWNYTVPDWKKKNGLHAVHLPRQRRSNMSLYLGHSCNHGNISASRIYVCMKWRPLAMQFFHWCLYRLTTTAYPVWITGVTVYNPSISNTHLEPCCVWKGWFITPNTGWPEILSKTPIKTVTHCSPLW